MINIFYVDLFHTFASCENFILILTLTTEFIGQQFFRVLFEAIPNFWPYVATLKISKTRFQGLNVDACKILTTKAGRTQKHSNETHKVYAKNSSNTDMLRLR